MKRYARSILAVVFLALLATPALMRRFGPRAAVASGSGDADPRLRYGFRLTESARQAGIDFVHQAPTLDRQARAHHAAGGSDGCVGCNRRHRCRRAARPLRHQQR